MPRRKKATEEIEIAETGWKRAEIECKGIAPLLLHNPATRDDVTLKDASDEKIAEACLYREDGYKGTGKIGFPTEMLFASLRDAGTMVQITLEGKKTKITVGGRSKSKGSSKSTLLPGILRIQESFIPLKDSEGEFISQECNNGWKVDKRMARNPTTGGMNPAVRARIDQWGFKISVEFDEKLLPEPILQKLFNEAGRWFGLGTFREGGFGRYRLTNLKIVEEKALNP